MSFLIGVTCLALVFAPEEVGKAIGKVVNGFNSTRK